MKKIAVISDTHGFLHPKILEFISTADQIWHAGDIGNYKIIERLNEIRPTIAVYGNIDDNDVRSVLPEYQHFTVGEVSALIIHIGGYPKHYDKKALDLIKTFKPKLFVCGHSHILKVVYDKENEMLVINPGAAGNSGFHSSITAVKFTIDKDDIKDLEVLDINRNKKF